MNSVAMKVFRFLVMTYSPAGGETPRTVWAVDAQDAVDQVKVKLPDDEEIMDVYKIVKGWKK